MLDEGLTGVLAGAGAGLEDDRGANLVACDPEASERVRQTESWLEIAPDPITAATGAEAVVLATEWPAYVTLDPVDLAAVMAGTVLLDGRNVLEASRVVAAGLTYASLGRG